MVEDTERKVIWIPKSHTNKMNKERLLEFALKQFYKHEPAKAKAFEREMSAYQDRPQMAEALQMMYKIPDMIFNFMRSVDHDFWHPKRGAKNYEMFGRIYKKAKITKAQKVFEGGSALIATTGEEPIISGK